MPKPNLLVIEDDPAVAENLRVGLTREGFAVTCVATGTEGTGSAQRDPPHLVLLDSRLPDGSGLDVCREMRQKGLRQPLIVLTARAEELDKVLGLEMGADGYITKPFGLRELAAHIRAQLRRAYGDYSGGDSTHCQRAWGHH